MQSNHAILVAAVIASGNFVLNFVLNWRWLRMAVRIFVRVFGLIVVTLMMGYLWLATSFDRGNSWIVLVPLVALVAFWVYWILAWWPKQFVLMRRSLLAGAVLAAVPLLVNYLVVRPITSKQQRVEGIIHANQTALAEALEQHECPDGHTLVVVPWVTLRGEEGNRQLVELFLLPSNQATRRVFLARTTAHNGLHLAAELEERWSELDACFDPPGGLRHLLNRMEQGDFADSSPGTRP